MEVSLLSSNAVKIKSKFASFAIQPFGIKAKQAVDAILIFSLEEIKNIEGIEGDPIIFSGPGEYELKSVKVTGVGKKEVVGYVAKIEGMDVYITKASLAAKAKESLTECTVAIIEEDILLDQAILATLNTSVAIIYGEKAPEHCKALNKDIPAVNKYSITKDKLPTELEIVLLG